MAQVRLPHPKLEMPRDLKKEEDYFGISRLRHEVNSAQGKPLHFAAGGAARTFLFRSRTFVLRLSTPDFRNTGLPNEGLK